MNKETSCEQDCIGIYGGTFDPIHYGHLNLAFEILEKRGLKEVWFCPARLSPHKLHQAPASVEHRMKMVELAIEEIPQFKLIDIELRREGPSYTIDTLKGLVAEEMKLKSPRKLGLILGNDSLQGLPHWKEVHEIIKLVPLLIGQRICLSKIPILGDPLLDQAIEQGYVPTSILEISSTMLRQRLAEGLYSHHLLPPQVAAYVFQNQLYKK